MIVLGEKTQVKNPAKTGPGRQLKLHEKVPYTVTIRKEWLEGGLFEVPMPISKYMTETNTVRVMYDNIDLVLPYYQDTRIVEGVHGFYCDKCLAEGDSFYVGLRELEPTQLLLCPGFKNTLRESESLAEHD